MFGDVKAEPSTSASESVLDFRRQITGGRVHWETSSGHNWSDTQVSRPHTVYVRDLLTSPHGTTLTLSHGRIVSGSEVVIVEVRDRLGDVARAEVLGAAGLIDASRAGIELEQFGHVGDGLVVFVEDRVHLRAHLAWRGVFRLGGDGLADEREGVVSLAFAEGVARLFEQILDGLRIGI